MINKILRTVKRNYCDRLILNLILCAALSILMSVSRLEASGEIILAPLNSGFKLSAAYEGRFNIIDPGDSTGRHAIFNILWLDLKKIETGEINIFAKARALGFEGDSSVKSHNAMNDLEALTFNEAYINKASEKYEFDFGMFHKKFVMDNRGELFDLSDLTYGFDVMNRIEDKKARGSVFYKKNIRKGIRAFFNYQFNVDYSSSLKTAGFNYKKLTFFKAFDSFRDYFVADYRSDETRKVNYSASYRNNKFNYLGPFDQYKLGADLNLNASIMKRKITRLSLEFLSNSTSNGYFHLKRNAADLMAANVIFFYQKHIGALKIESELNDRFKTSLTLESYFSITPGFGVEDGLAAGPGRVKMYKMAALSHYKNTTVETAILKTSGNDGSYLLKENLNFRVRVLYPF
ncbi:MAG: hypothetical protein BWY32_01406 [bacterium ADurb.Bin243]|nr:MAG: hypothetical protein BWY32_01406 [bacterium ADurb.Bin243]